MLASLHYNKRGDIFFIFSAIITLLKALLASLAQAEAKSLEFHQSTFNLTIAFLAAFSVFWQSLLKNWNYNKGEATLHDDSAAAALGKIYKNTRLKARELRANEDESKDGKNDPKPNEDEKEVNETNNMLHSLVAQFEQATKGCTSLVPAKINAAFELLDNKIVVCKRKVYKTGTGTDEENAKKVRVKVKWDSVYTSLYRELSAVIIRRKKWPFFLPDPESVVNETIDKYQKEKHEDEANGSLLKIVLDRNASIKRQYSVFNTTPTPSASAE